METQTDTDTGTGTGTQGRRRRRGKSQPETPLDLYRQVVQQTHRFQTKAEQIAAFVEQAEGYPTFFTEFAELWARLHYHDVNPRRPDSRKPEEKEAEKKAAEQKAEDAKRKFSLALANTFLNAKLTTGMLARKASGPQLRAEGGKFYKVAKKIPKGKVLDDIASTDEQRLAIAAVLEA